MRRRYIDVTNESRQHLCKVFSCTSAMVSKALRFNSDSDLARRIRYVALKEERGSLISERAPICETFHEDDNVMEQHFSDRVKLIVYKNTGRTCVLIDGVVKKSEDNLSIAELMQLQKEVSRIADEYELK